MNFVSCAASSLSSSASTWRKQELALLGGWSQAATYQRSKREQSNRRTGDAGRGRVRGRSGGRRRRRHDEREERRKGKGGPESDRLFESNLEPSPLDSSSLFSLSPLLSFSLFLCLRSSPASSFLVPLVPGAAS